MDETLTSVLESQTTTPVQDDTVLVAMRLAERVHREHDHFRKAPCGEDRPAYFLHLTEVAWMLKDAGMSDDIVAAGFLHDVIEDCGYTREQLARELGNEYIADLVEWVSEPEKGNGWETRNRAYLERMQHAPPEARALSCADKTSNLNDMLRLLNRGYALDEFMSRGKTQQIEKFERLDEVFRGHVPDALYFRFSEARQLLKAHPGNRRCMQ